MAIMHAVLLYVSILVNLAVSTPVSNITTDVSHPTLVGCICPWEKGDYGCHIIHRYVYPDIPAGWPGRDYNAVSRGTTTVTSFG